MKPRITVITLGVASLERSRRFYCGGLGWKASSRSNGHMVLIDAGGIVLGLYPRRLLAEDANVEAKGFGGMALAQYVTSEAEVNTVLDSAVNAGATAAAHPGGVSAHWFSTLYALPFLANRALPEWLGNTMLNTFAPRDRDRHEKFRAYYSWGRGQGHRI